MKIVNSPIFYLMPSLACPAQCEYCFSPHQAGLMDEDTMKSSVDWMYSMLAQQELEERETTVEKDENTAPIYWRVTFHGGEPLLMGPSFLRGFFDYVDTKQIPWPSRYSVQTNLWLLDDEYLRIFKERDFFIGTSLDGPEQINDSQRGKGYFKKTMAGINRLRSADIPVSAICTFTKRNAPYYKEIFDFFKSENLDFTFFIVQPVLNSDNADPFAMNDREQADTVLGLLDYYLENFGQIKVKALDVLGISTVIRDTGGFIEGNCLGRQFAIGPKGGIYNCQMFAGREEYQFDTVFGKPSPGQIRGCEGWKWFEKRLEDIDDECTSCSYKDLCKGSCGYNTLMKSGWNYAQAKDPNCAAYHTVLDGLVQRQGSALQSGVSLTKAALNSGEALSPEAAMKLLTLGYSFRNPR